MGLKLFLNTTVTKKATVSLIDENGKVVAKEKGTEPLPAISKLLTKTKTSLKDIDEIASHPGPGSFTGLRVGAAVAGALNFALGKKPKQEKIRYE